MSALAKDAEAFVVSVRVVTDCIGTVIISFFDSSLNINSARHTWAEGIFISQCELFIRLWEYQNLDVEICDLIS